MREISWDDYEEEDPERCDTCRSAPCRCDDDYEQWKESQLDDDRS
jgi:hypothetical protein